MKTKSRKKVAEKKPSGKSPNDRKGRFYPIIYIDIEVSYSKGDKPFIGQICILSDKSKVLYDGYFEDPREITSKDAKTILTLLYSNYAVCCDPTLDIRVIKSDARRCGLRLKTSKLRFIDIQFIEYQIRRFDARRIALDRLARQYRIKPPIKFHDSFSDVSVIKSIFEAQLKTLRIDKEHLHKLDQLKK